MSSGDLKFLPVACWWPLVESVATNFILYCGQYYLFPVSVGGFSFNKHFTCDPPCMMGRLCRYGSWGLLLIYLPM